MKNLFFGLLMIIGVMPVTAGSFIENRGQFDDNVKAIRFGSTADIWIESDGITFDFYRLEGNSQGKLTRQEYLEKLRNPGKEIPRRIGHVVKMKFKRGSGAAEWQAGEYENYRFNYISTAKTVQNVAPSQTGLLKNIYPGIDLKTYTEKSNFRYDFIVSPGASPESIKMHFDGDKGLKINESGNLEISTSLGQVELTGLFVYQRNSDAPTAPKSEIESSFKIFEDGTVGFEIGNYDKTKDLIIDPMVIASYCGGSSEDNFNDIYVDNSYIYTAGYTYSSDFPTSVGAYETSYDAGKDIVVSKFSKDGKKLLYSTYITGSADDYANAIAVKNGIATVVGHTKSNDFLPVSLQSTAYQDTPEGNGDGFILKLNADGSDMTYATFFGGDRHDEIKELIFDEEGNLLFVGDTESDETESFPLTSNVKQKQNYGSRDAFITKMSPDGKNLLYSCFFGESGLEYGEDVAIDSQGNVYITGLTESSGLVTSDDAFQSSLGGFVAAYAVKHNSDFSERTYLTYFGGTGEFDVTSATAIEVDEDFNIYIAGEDGSENFPSTSGVIRESNPFASSFYFDAFVAKLRQGTSDAAFVTLLGGDNDEKATDLELSSTNEAIVVGNTNSSNYHLSTDAEQSTFGGDPASGYPTFDAFLTVLNDDATAITYSTYFGGDDEEGAHGVFYDCEVFASGYSKSDDMPTVSGGYQTSRSGNYDGWITKYSFSSEALTLVSPVDEAYNINGFAEFEVSGLDAGDTWKIQIASDSDFEEIVSEQSFANSSIQLDFPLENDTDYWWRARRISEGFCGDWSAGRTFRTTRFAEKYNWNWKNPLPPVMVYGGMISFNGKLTAFGKSGIFSIERNASEWHAEMKSEFSLSGKCYDADSISTDLLYVFYGDTDGNSVIVKSDKGAIDTVYKTTTKISCFDFIDSETGFYCDDNGEIYKTTDAGTSWTAANLGNTSILNDIFFYDDNTGFLCGEDGKIFYTTDAGANWAAANISGTGQDLYRIVSFDGTNAYACGINSSICKSTNAGADWNEVYTGPGDLLEIINISGDILFLGEDAIIKETSPGVWEDTYEEASSGNRIFRGAARHSGKYYAVGESGEFAEIDASGFVESEKSDLIANINSIAIKDENTAFAFGDAVYKTNDGGATWYDESSQLPDTFVSGHFLYAGYGFAATNFRYFYKTTDGGATWTKFDTGIDKDIYDIRFVTSEKGMILMDNDAYLTNDGGATWTYKSTPAFDIMRMLTYSGGNWYLACGDIWKSSNDGDTWTKYTTGTGLTDLFCVETRDNSTIFFGGDGGIIKSDDNGSNWNWSFQETGIVISDIAILDENRIWAVSESGIVYESKNGGQSWTRAGICQAAGITDIEIDNAVNIWAAGNNGTAVKSDVSIDTPKMYTQTIILENRWNMISTYVSPVEVKFGDVFEDADMFLAKNTNGAVYLPAYDIDGIGEFKKDEGYLIYMTKADTIQITGEYSDTENPTVHLKQGWNMIAYPNDKEMPLTDALDQIITSGKLFLLKNENGAVVMPAYGIYQVTTMQPGKGYLLYMTQEEENFSFPLAP